MGKKKTNNTKMSLTDFLGGQQAAATAASWADEMELPTAPAESSRGTIGGRGFGGDDGPRPTIEDLPTRGPFSAYVGNLPFDVSEGDIEAFFSECQVVSIRIPMNYETQRPKGFCYVEFRDRDNLFQAINMHGTNMGNRTLRINIAEQRENQGGDERSNSNAWRRTGPLDEDQGPKPADTETNWRRAAPVIPPAASTGGYSRERFGSSNDRYNNNDNNSGERGPPRVISQAETVSNWRSGAGPRAPTAAPLNTQGSFGGRSFDRGAGDEQRSFRSAAPPSSSGSGERKKLVLQPRSKPLGQ